MDFHSLFSGFLFGIPVGVGLTYLFTHPEARTALFARLHSTAEDVHKKITDALAKK
jgi:hypothetical protein